MSDSQVTLFRDQHNIAKIKEVDILFLTGTFSIDISAKSIKDISEIKHVLQVKKQIPVHLQKLYSSKCELEDQMKTVVLCLQNDFSVDCIALTLVIYQPKIIYLNLICYFGIGESFRNRHSISIKRDHPWSIWYTLVTT